MNKNLIIGVIALVLIAAGGVFLVSGGDDSDDISNSAANNTSREADNSEGQSVATAPFDTFNNVLGIDTEVLSGNYRITVTEVEGGTGTSATIEIDNDGNTKTTATSSGQSINLIYHEGETYTQDPSSGNWIKFPSGSPDGAESTYDITSGITKDDIEEFTDVDIKDLGEMPCESGTCRVYESADKDGAMGTIYVDSNTNRLTKVMITENNETKTVLDVSYEYPESVTIEPPADYQEFEIPSFN